jgi:hypothetical protein
LNKILKDLQKIVDEYENSKAKDSRSIILEEFRNEVEEKLEKYLNNVNIEGYTVENNDVFPGNAKFKPILKTLQSHNSNDYQIPQNVVKYVYINVVLKNKDILFYDFYTKNKKKPKN